MVVVLRMHPGLLICACETPPAVLTSLGVFNFQSQSSVYFNTTKAQMGGSDMCVNTGRFVCGNQIIDVELVLSCKMVLDNDMSIYFPL